VDYAHWGHHIKKKKRTLLLYLCGGVEKNKKYKNNIYTGSFTTRALEKKRKQEIAFGCVILKKKKSSLKDIREKTT
jgi:hypothetical protein